MDWFKNLVIKKKLLYGFGVTVVITILIGSFSIWAMKSVNVITEEINSNRSPSIIKMLSIKYNFAFMRQNVLQHVLSTDDKDMDKYESILSTIQMNIQKDLDDYKVLISDAEERKAYEELVQSFSQYILTRDKMLSASRKNQNVDARNMSRGIITEIAIKTLEKIDAITKMNIDAINKLSTNASETYKSMILFMTLSLVLSMAIGLLVAIFITKSITSPIRVLIDGAENIAKGNLKNKIEIMTHEEFGKLAHSFSSIVNTLNELIEAMNEMSYQHELGDIDAKMDPKKFQGIYQTVVEGINKMVFDHISVKKRAMAIFKEFGEGNFEASLEKLPGKKAFINETIEQVRDNLKGLIAEANLLSEAAIAGNLSVRADASKHKGDFSKILVGVNKTLDAVINPLNVSASYIDRISKGDVPPLITERYNGDFNTIKNNINTMINTFNSFVFHLDKMKKEQESGNIDYFIDSHNFQGVYKLMVEGVNEQVGAQIELNKKIMEGIGAYAKGDFSFILPQQPGKKAIINEYMNMLKKNMQAVNEELHKLFEATSEGNLNIRGNSKRFDYAFYADMVEGINKMIDQVVFPINETKEVMQEVSNGNLIMSMKGNYKGSFSELKESVNATIQKWKEIITYLYKIASEINENANKLNETSAELSAGASEQAASLEETSSSIEEITATINQNNDNAKATSTISLESSKKAEEGGKAVIDTLHAMKQITERISVIEEIASQTNLLAVNASIEAARAGENGYGFQIVATEVRKLAGMSKKAAKEIQEMASSSLEIANNAGNLIKEIIPNIKKTSDLVQEISYASNEQSLGMNQINTAVNQLNQVAQNSINSAETLTSVSGTLQLNSESLKNSVSFFRI